MARETERLMGTTTSSPRAKHGNGDVNAHGNISVFKAIKENEKVEMEKNEASFGGNFKLTKKKNFYCGR